MLVIAVLVVFAVRVGGIVFPHRVPALVEQA